MIRIHMEKNFLGLLVVALGRFEGTGRFYVIA
jgi:hypothetical protein